MLIGLNMKNKFSISGDVQAKSVSSLVENVTNIAQRTFKSCNLVRIDERLASEQSKFKSKLSSKEAKVKVFIMHSNKMYF